jgi:predicted Rossmann fold nucleotide-binding protein DprA/Smf involved in DNA uptake
MVRRDPSAVGRLAKGKGSAQTDLSGRTAIDRGLEDARRRLLEMAECGINAFALSNPEYPRLLAAILDPPLVLYSIGTVSAFDGCVAISGTRKPSEWGLRMAERLGAALAREGWIVTSGLAQGIDTPLTAERYPFPQGGRWRFRPCRWTASILRKIKSSPAR